MTFPIYAEPLPYLTTAQMMEVDRLMIEVYGIQLVQMMESAGRNLAHLARMRFLAGNPAGNKVVVLAGSGGNGGGALVCARRLHNFGADVLVVLTKPGSQFTAVPAHQLSILQSMGVPVLPADQIGSASSPDLIIDGIIGYSLQGAPRGTAVTLIEWANDQPAPILALDIPSGVDSTSGKVFGTAINAAATMTLALPKEGLRALDAAPYVGELYLADISVPPALYAYPTLQLTVPPTFAASEVLRLK